MRCRVERTIFLAERPDDARVFIARSDCRSSFNVAFRIPGTRYNLYNTMNHWDRLLTFKAHDDNGVRTWHGVNRLFMVSRDASRTVPAIADALLVVIEHPECDPGEFARNSRTGRAWIRELKAGEYPTSFLIMCS